VSAPEPYIDARKLATVMGVSVTTIKRLTAQGMPSETWGMKRTRRYLASEATAWARARPSATMGANNANTAQRLISAGSAREE
jgi:hypothetical protein